MAEDESIRNLKISFNLFRELYPVLMTNHIGYWGVAGQTKETSNVSTSLNLKQKTKTALGFFSDTHGTHLRWLSSNQIKLLRLATQTFRQEKDSAIRAHHIFSILHAHIEALTKNTEDKSPYKKQIIDEIEKIENKFSAFFNKPSLKIKLTRVIEEKSKLKFEDLCRRQSKSEKSLTPEIRPLLFLSSNNLMSSPDIQQTESTLHKTVKQARQQLSGYAASSMRRFGDYAADHLSKSQDGKYILDSLTDTFKHTKVNECRSDIEEFSNRLYKKIVSLFQIHGLISIETDIASEANQISDRVEEAKKAVGIQRDIDTTFWQIKVGLDDWKGEKSIKKTGGSVEDNKGSVLIIMEALHCLLLDASDEIKSKEAQQKDYCSFDDSENYEDAFHNALWAVCKKLNESFTLQLFGATGIFLAQYQPRLSAVSQPARNSTPSTTLQIPQFIPNFSGLFPEAVDIKVTGKNATGYQVNYHQHKH